MEYKYKAFISYRRTGRDSIAAEVLQQMLEQYVIPEDNRTGRRKKLGSIFRDKTHIDGDPNLRQIIYNALDSSEYLIVICSREIMDPTHPWVMEEIRYFLNKHPDSRNKILTVLVGDEPDRAIPDILWSRNILPDGTANIELPNYLDIRGKSVSQMRNLLRDQFVKLCATLLSCNPDALARREEKRRRKQIYRWMGGITVVAAIIIGILAWSNIRIDDKNKELDQANQNLDQANQDLEQINRNLEEINQDLEQQIRDRLLRESELLTQSALQALSTGDQHSAIRDAIDALPSPDMPRPYYAPAEQALFSALNLFNPSSSNLILRDTVLESTSPIDTICVNADGSRLITADRYGTLNCFDTTGKHIWTKAISVGGVYPCEIYDSFIVISGNTISSLHQDSGEILWETENDYLSGRIKLSDDGSYAVCFLDNEDFSIPTLSLISMLDGSVIRTIQLVDEDIYTDVHTSTYHTDTYVFSSDGRYLAGCFGEYSNSSAIEHQMVLWVVDTYTGETVILQKYPSTYYLIPCYLEFTDYDTTLTIIQYADNHAFTFRAEKISIAYGNVLWQTDTPEEEFDYYAHYMKWLDWLYFDDYLLLGAQQVLYALDMTDGRIIDTEHLDSKLIRMERLDQDTFSIVLEDGTYTTGHISDNDLSLHMDMTYLYYPVPVMDLGAVCDVLFINGGYLRGRNGTEVRPTTISSENQLPCCVAMIPQENDWNVVIRRAVPFDPALEEIELYTYEDVDSYYLSAHICGSDTLVLSDNSYASQHMFFDRSTLEPRGIFIEDDFSPYRFLKNGISILGLRDGVVCIYDIVSQKTTPLPSYNDEIQMSFNGRTIKSTVLAENYKMLTTNCTLATIFATEHGLRIWLDDQKQPDIPFPAELFASYPEGLTSCELRIYENGFVQLYVHYEGQECLCDNYYFYSIWEKEWYSFPIDEHISDCHDTCLGISRPTFTTLDDTGTIRIYDMASREETFHFDIGINPSTIHNMRWIMDDRYLAVHAGLLQIFILDGITGEVVFSHTATMINYATSPTYALIYTPQYAADPSGKRLYIWDQECICVDTESWTKLADIPHMLMYDPVSDMVLTFESFGVELHQPKHVTAIRLPTTEELVAIGKAYLGE
jgi:hypothetical protein